MTDWLAFSRACVGELERVLAELPTRTEREPVLRAGEGGDDTTAIDAAAEDVVVRRLESLGADLTLVSEELGVRTFGAIAFSHSPVHVVVDPIDGSVNAKRGIPYFSLSLAVADGPTMDDVAFGFVHDFGAGEEWVAERGAGGRLNDVPLDGPGPIEAADLPAMSANGRGTDHPEADTALPEGGMDLTRVVEGMEERLLRQALSRAHGVKAEAARLLGLKPSALYYKLEKYGIA